MSRPPSPSSLALDSYGPPEKVRLVREVRDFLISITSTAGRPAAVRTHGLRAGRSPL